MTGDESEEFPAPASGHVQFRDRVHKTLYYGQYSDRSLPSLAVTDVAVDVLSSVAPSKKKCLDRNYAMVVSRRAKISPCTLMMGILYSERLRQGNPEYLNRVSSSDLFLISMMVASKYLYDEGEDEEVFNDDWAKAGSKAVEDVNKLEVEFLASIDWNLFITNKEFLNFVNKVESRVATTLGLCRGWFTYGDLTTLFDNSSFRGTLELFRHELLKVICGCALAYVLSLSLALSLTTAVSRHFCITPAGGKLTVSPSASTPPAPSLTTETTCRFDPPAVTPSANTSRCPSPKTEAAYRPDSPAVIRMPSLDIKVIISLAGKEMVSTRNALGWRQFTNVAARGKPVKKEIRKVVDVGRAWSRLKCDDDEIFCQVVSSELSVKSTNPIGAPSDPPTRSHGPGIFKRSWHLFPMALFRLSFLRNFPSIASSLNSVVISHRKSILFSVTRDQLDDRLYSSNTNRSSICIGSSLH